MLRKRNLQEMIDQFQKQTEHKRQIVHWHTIEEKKHS